MTFMNRNVNIKQFQLIKFINENSGDDHVMSKISIVLPRDKIEAPHYVITKVRLPRVPGKTVKKTSKSISGKGYNKLLYQL